MKRTKLGHWTWDPGDFTVIYQKLRELRRSKYIFPLYRLCAKRPIRYIGILGGWHFWRTISVITMLALSILAPHSYSIFFLAIAFTPVLISYGGFRQIKEAARNYYILTEIGSASRDERLDRQAGLMGGLYNYYVDASNSKFTWPNHITFRKKVERLCSVLKYINFSLEGAIFTSLAIILCRTLVVFPFSFLVAAYWIFYIALASLPVTICTHVLVVITGSYFVETSRPATVTKEEVHAMLEKKELSELR